MNAIVFLQWYCCRYKLNGIVLVCKVNPSFTAQCADPGSYLYVQEVFTHLYSKLLYKMCQDFLNTQQGKPLKITVFFLVPGH